MFNPFVFCKNKTMKTAHWQEATADFSLCNSFNSFAYKFPSGTKFKAFETQNAGWVVLHPDTVCLNAKTFNKFYRQ